ncbi:integral membrane protein GPR155-like [Mya arenaria]|uniref:integral membrane protein GPR155-like n=1 Tax=Mya arenaria TaxID=6604 RepID=UPI0022E13FEF|nr:integral membrane protein GPR155-like [Mya arenaria]XP_052804659.1 integral membrane protein GPR155-like [Mya arenaria]XP_052804667.1 integral membrane protein GPR155-like [Mya arenaria]
MAASGILATNLTEIGNLSTSNIMSNLTRNTTTHEPAALSIDNLYPAIFQCFAIIMAGYIAGRANLITEIQGKGIGTFVGKFCLPALLFRSMVVLDFSQVNWYFLLGIAISKTAVFIAVAGLTLLIKRPVHLGYAGLFAIFATQSNDFALGYPILKALYEDTHPEYLQYIYLVAPISLIFLNPIGFVLLEIHRRRHDTTRRASMALTHSSQLLPAPTNTCHLALHVAKNVLSNPIVFMVIIGIAGNFVFKQKIPNVLDDILLVLGNAFSASALFYLGLNLVGKVSGQLGLGLVVPLLLIMAKTLLMPLITWQVVGALELHGPSTNDSRSLSMYAFLYGTFPTAPSVFIYASHFSVAQDIIATGMVVCTFLSAPLMFVSAKMMTVVVSSEMDYKTLLLDTSFDLSVVSLVFNVWILAVLIFSRKHKRMPHQFLICLVLAQSLACIGMIIYDGLDTHIVWTHYLQFVMLLIGVFSTRCFAAVLSIVLYLLHCRSLCFVLRNKGWMYIFALGFPMVGTGMLLIFGDHHLNNEIDPSFHYGTDQALLSVVVLTVCSAINITFLVLRQRNARQSKERSIKVGKKSLPRNINTETNEEESITERLLPADDIEPSSTRRTRTSSTSKLLCDGDGSRYRSCSNCTHDCEVKLYEQPVPESSVSIEDMVPFPDDQPADLKPTANKSRTKRHFSRLNSKDMGNCGVKKQPKRKPGGNINPPPVDRGMSSNSGGFLPTPEDMASTPRETSSPARTASSSTTSEEDSLLDSIQTYECDAGTCSYQQRRRCAGLLRCYHSTSRNIQVQESGDAVGVKVKRQPLSDEYQTDRFIILLLSLQVSMFVGLFLCTWRLFNDAKSGIYVEIEFLDSFFNYGQSLVVFAIFGFDTQLMILPCIRRIRKLLYGVEVVHLPSPKQITEHEKQTCEQFSKYHKSGCEDAIVRDMKYRFRTYNKVFCGTSLCDWLQEVGLVHTRGEAVSYGRTLLRGRVICHVTEEHDFHDMPYFYRFLEEDEIEEDEFE